MQWKIGDKASIKRLATKEDINMIAKISGDYNPIHFNEKAAIQSCFEGIVMHGLFCLGMISQLIGMELPGEGAILMDEELRYTAPVYVGDTIEATVEIVEINHYNGKMKIAFSCKNQHGKYVMKGSTMVKVVCQ
ncbi:MAG: MaoC family dehydratase [Firmicutes bacterium]|nr:MaoC family dehydratase [Bacillota bacterium]